MKRHKIFASLLLVIVALFTLASCSSKEVDKYENMASVTFVLNGGTFKNSDKNLIYYYMQYSHNIVILVCLNN